MGLLLKEEEEEEGEANKKGEGYLQMLSVENNPDPSCSGLKRDGRTAEELALQRAADPVVEPEGLDEIQPPPFSIRDYVFTARSKDIEANWPFPQHILQLFLKHGVKDILPPFEPPDLVGGQCCSSIRSHQLFDFANAEKTIAEIALHDKEATVFSDSQGYDIKHSHVNLDQSVLELSDRGSKKSCQLSNQLGLKETRGGGNINSTIVSHVQIGRNCNQADGLTSSVQETNSHSEALVELEGLKPPYPTNKTESSSGPSDKKYRLIVKLGGFSEFSRTEEIVSNSTALSEPMTSKVCPVCKTFASTSNTTLNAHIDQCLAAESTCKQVINDVTKYRVKPRKKRSMVDICATAPHCTLEDLDRRNGTNWAADLNLSLQNGEVRVESKRQRIGQVDVSDDGDDERAVYVDSNGTKLRILSKFNDMVAPTAIEDCTPRNHLKDAKRYKSFLIGKRERLVAKCSKYMKVKPQSKKLRSFRLSKDEIPEASPDNELYMENYEKERSLSQLLKAGDSAKASGCGTLGHWACSKRSGLSKKIGSSSGRWFAGDTTSMAQDPLIEGNHVALGNSSAGKNHILKFSRLPQNGGASRSKRVEISLNIKDNNETSRRAPESNFNRLLVGTSFDNGCKLKFARSSGSYTSPRSKRVEISMGTENSGFRKNLLLGKSSVPLEPSKYNSNKKNSTSIKLQRDKHAAEMSETVCVLPSDVDEGYDQMHDSTEILEPSSVKMNNMHMNNKLKHLNTLGYEMEEITNNESIGRNEPLESEYGREEAISSSVEEDTEISKELDSALECCSHEVTSVCSEEGGSVCQYHESEDQESVSEGFPDNASREQLKTSDEAKKSDCNAPPICANARSVALENDHVGPVNRSKSWVGLATPRSCDHLAMDGSGQVVDADKAQIAAGVEAPIQGHGGSFLSPGEMGFEAQENSSVTSSGPHFTQDQHQQGGGDPSGSPLSANSAISTPPATISDVKVLDKLSASSSERSAEGESSALPSTTSGEAIEKVKFGRENQKVTVLAEKEPVKISDLPCCCSRKESFSRGDNLLPYQEPQLQRHKNVTAATAGPAKGRQVGSSNPHFRPDFCTVSTSSVSRIDEVVIPTLDLPVASTSMKASSTVATGFPTSSDFGLGSPSSQTQSPTSLNPVLRLMGKNLMVMSKAEESESVSPGKVPLDAPNDLQNAKYLSLLGFSTGNFMDQANFPFHHQAPDDSFIFGSDPCYPSKNFEADISGGLRNCSNCKVVHHTPLQVAANHRDVCGLGIMGRTLQQQGSKMRNDGLPNRKPSSPFSYNAERSAPHGQCPRSISLTQALNPTREVILIDDSPELVSSSSSIGAKYIVGSRRNQQLPVVTSSPLVLTSNSTPLKMFGPFQTPDPFAREVSPGPKPSFLMSCPGANASSSKRSGASQGSSVLSQSSFVIQSPSTGFLNPTLYYSSSLQ